MNFILYRNGGYYLLDKKREDESKVTRDDAGNFEEGMESEFKFYFNIIWKYLLCKEIKNLGTFWKHQKNLNRGGGVL